MPSKAEQVERVLAGDRPCHACNELSDTLFVMRRGRTWCRTCLIEWLFSPVHTSYSDFERSRRCT